MNLKDLSIAKKLSAGFGFVLLLLIAVSAISLMSSDPSCIDMDNVMVANNLKQTMFGLEKDHLKFLNKAQKFFIDPNMEKMDVQTDDHKCRLGKWLYGEDRRDAEKVVPQLAPIFKSLEAPMLPCMDLFLKSIQSPQSRVKSLRSTRQCRFFLHKQNRPLKIYRRSWGRLPLPWTTR